MSVQRAVAGAVLVLVAILLIGTAGFVGAVAFDVGPLLDGVSDGDGSVDMDDPNALMATMDHDVVEGNGAAYDYNCNGRVDYGDIIRLGREAQGDGDSGGAKSGALFVDPVESPAGKARSILESELFADRSQTVLAAFPELGPTRGMVVQYDRETDGGAAVTVLANGVIEIGQGSAATDRFTVSVRETDGTWHGPETITLTEPDG